MGWLERHGRGSGADDQMYDAERNGTGVSSAGDEAGSGYILYTVVQP